MTDFRVTGVTCVLCQQKIRVEQLRAWGLDSLGLAEELSGKRLITVQLNQLRLLLEQHQQAHQCCQRGHDCSLALVLAQPAWYPW